MDYAGTVSQSSSDNNDIANMNTTTIVDAAQDANRRRSSNRSIKRRRFDDELVEYSLGGVPGTSLPKVDKRVRTQSYSSPYSDMLNATSQPIVPTTYTPHDLKKNRSHKPTPGVGGKRNRRKAHLSQLSTKDLGRWKPTDDLALIINVQLTNDLRIVHRGVKFTCRFTLSEIQSRWYALLYNTEISRVAVAAMRNLHPELVASIQSKALYSTSEENLLGTILSTSQPTLDKFQELLDQNPTVFYPSRSAKSLMSHWQLLKQYQLLPDQTVHPLPKGDSIQTFSDAEDTMKDSELPEKDEAVETEMHLADRVDKKEIRLLENSLNRWHVLVQSVAAGASNELDKNTLAVLRGRLVRYLMRSKEITVGRSTRDYTVDVDLTLEGPSAKVSRKQGTIRLRNNGDFFMSSEGKRPLFVDGRPILHGNKVKLNRDSVIEIAGLRFVFIINQEYVSAIRQEAVKVNLQQ